MIKDGKLDAIPSSTALSHPPKTDFNKYDLNSYKIAIVDEINRGQGSEEGRASPALGEFVEVTSKKSQKERQRKEKEEHKRQEEERRRDENKKKRKQGGGVRVGSSSERPHHQSSGGSNKPYTSWLSNPSAEDAPVATEEVWDVDESLLSHLPVVSAAPGSQLKHPPTAHPITPQPPPPQAPPQAPPIQSQTSSMWTVDAHKPGVPHTAELVTHISDYTLFGGGGGILSHAMDSTLPIASAMSPPMSVQQQQQQQGSTPVASGQKETATVSGERKKEGWQPQSKPNDQESPLNDIDDTKSLQRSEKSGSRGRGASGSKNLPPRFKPLPPQGVGETSGPGRGRGARMSGRGSSERRVPGRDRDKIVPQENAVEKKLPSTLTTSEHLPDKDKVRSCIDTLCVLRRGV